MPATYAHWQFGDKCISLMPLELQRIVYAHRDIYNYGVHGPDILFYYLTKKEVTKYGSNMHEIPAMSFFEKTKEVLQEHEEHKEKMLAYVLGFLTHFTLDSMCHGYVEKKRTVCNITHNIVESKWDKHLIEQDCRLPNMVDRAESLKPNKLDALVISYFFPFSDKDILTTCKAHKRIVHTLNCFSIRKEEFWKTFLHLLKQDNFCDLFVGFEDIEVCSDSNLRLDKLKTKALEQFPKLLKNYMKFLNSNNVALDPYFNKTYGAPKNLEDICVLEYSQELSYKL